MRIIEIEPLSNGAHRNQQGQLSSIPEGWAVIPEGIVIPDTFPFVNIAVEDDTVTEITAGIVPEPEPETEHEKTAYDEMAEAYTQGVNSI